MQPCPLENGYVYQRFDCDGISWRGLGPSHIGLRIHVVRVAQIMCNMHLGGGSCASSASYHNLAVCVVHTCFPQCCRPHTLNTRGLARNRFSWPSLCFIAVLWQLPTILHGHYSAVHLASRASVHVRLHRNGMGQVATVTAGLWWRIPTMLSR